MVQRGLPPGCSGLRRFRCAICLRQRRVLNRPVPSASAADQQQTQEEEPGNPHSSGGMINTSQVGLPSECMAFGNGNWASIGAGFGGLAGASFTDLEGKRLIGMLGDGAFQMTAQELSTLVKYKRDAALFVLNNAGYAAERAIHPGKERSYNDVQVRTSVIPDPKGAAGGPQLLSATGQLPSLWC